MTEREAAIHGGWIGTITGLFFWYLVVAPAVADNPLLILVTLGLFGGGGGHLGQQVALRLSRA